jgi:hypothetical protein
MLMSHPVTRESYLVNAESRRRFRVVDYALLDRERGGCWNLRPRGRFQSKQSCVDDGNVLQTCFECSNGTLMVIDCMVLSDGAQKLRPQCEIVRIATCMAGEVGGRDSLRTTRRL